MRSAEIGNRRVLIVDDNRSIHDDFKKVLLPSSSGELDDMEAKLLGTKTSEFEMPTFELLHALQGSDAVQMVKKANEDHAPIAMAFVDIRMPPGMDGVQTVEKIWQQDPRVQIAFCTAYSDHTCEDISAKFQRTDQLLFIRKPFDNIEIFQVACAMVNKWNLAQQVARQLVSLEEAVERRARELDAAYKKQSETEEQFHRAQKMEAIGRLTGGVAHDFNNLLTVVLGYVEVLISKPEKFPSEVMNKLLAIQKASNSAAKLTGQLLSFSRQQITRPEIFDLNAVINETREMLARIIGEDIALSLELEPEPSLIRADKSQIEQVLMNLVVNARDAIDGKGGKVVLETSLENGNGRERRVILSVKDTGKGMSQDVKERIFEPFFTTKEVGKGTGLGLSTVYGIVAKHNGRIVVDSEVDEGTTFKLSFPLVSKGAVARSDVSSPEVESALGKETIMLVEDEEAVRSLASSVLKEAGYVVLEAPNGVEALKVLSTKKPKIDLLLTDVIMPRMGGKELARGVLERSPMTPVVFMSGYTGQDPLMDEREDQSSFLQKPFLATELLRKVRDALDPRTA